MIFHSSNVVYVSRLKRLLRSFQRCNHLVAPGIKFGIFFLEFRMSQHVINGAANSLVKTDLGTESGHSALEFGIIEYHGIRLVANQAPQQVVTAMLMVPVPPMKSAFIV